MFTQLYQKLDDPDTLIQFRRNFSLGSSGSINTLRACISSGDIKIETFDQAAPVFNTIVMQRSDDIAAYFMSDVINGQLPLTQEAKVSGVYQSIAVSCVPPAMASFLQQEANLSQSDSQDDLPTAALVVLTALSSTPNCTAQGNLGRLKAQQVVEFVGDKMNEAQTDARLTKAVYAMANTRHPNSIDKVLDFTVHKSDTVRSGAVRALGNVPTVRTNN